jgi:alpha-ketoglutarate-dependent taurine dioxygenase
MAIEVEPLQPFGALVRGWDPAATTAAVGRQLCDALAAHHVLVLRGQRRPTGAELAELGFAFGEVAPAADLYTGIAFDRREILHVSNELDTQGREKGVAGSGAIPWHNDYAFRDDAAKETFLEAFRLPDDGGPSTCFLDMYDAYETLPDDLRDRVEGLVGRHTLHAAGAYAAPTDDPEERAARARQANPDLTYPDDGRGVPHPVVHVHPETGRRALYVSAFVRDFDGCTAAESRALLDALLVHADQPSRHYCHRWQLGDLVISDQVGTVHKRGAVRADAGRTMRQMSTLLPV